MESVEVQYETAHTPSATVSVKMPNDTQVQETSPGAGSVEAIFNALEKVVEGKVHVLDYRVSSIGKGRDALAEAVINLTYNGEELTGIDAAQDVLEASAKAYLNAINRNLLQLEMNKIMNTIMDLEGRIEWRVREMKKRVAVLRGDGIGKEVTDAAMAVLDAIGRRFHHEFEWVHGAIGGEAIDTSGKPAARRNN